MLRVPVSPLTFAHKRLRMGSRQSTGPQCAISSGAPEGLSDGCKGAPAAPGAKLPIMGEESLMSQKGHGTCAKPVQQKLRWSCDPKLADRICWCVPLTVAPGVCGRGLVPRLLMPLRHSPPR